MNSKDGLSDWYESVRPRGYPSFGRVEAAAKRILKQLGENLEPGDLVFEIWNTLRTNLKKFDPQKVNTGKPVDVRFLSYFAHWFKKRVAQRFQRSRNRRKKEQVSLRSYADWRSTCDPAPSTSREEIYWQVAKRFFWEALAGLDAEDRAFIRYRYIEDVTLKSIAEKLDMSERTVKRRAKIYTLESLGKLVRQRVRERFFGLPRLDVYVEVVMLQYQYDFTLKEIASLFCVSVDELAWLHLQIIYGCEQARDERRRMRAS